MGSKYGLKGINDLEHICSVCGRQDLKRVMWLVELDQDGAEIGDAFQVGTTCGAKLLGVKTKDFTKQVDGLGVWIAKQQQARMRAHPRWADLVKIRADLDELMTVRDRMNAVKFVGWNEAPNVEIRAMLVKRNVVEALIMKDVDAKPYAAMPFV